MLLTIMSLFFWWLIYRELKEHIKAFFGFNAEPKPIFTGYVITLLFLAIACAWSPVHYWRFSRFLSTTATQLADNHPAKVHCNTLFDTLFDEDIGIGGHASPETGDIVIQYPRCAVLMDYIKHPERAGREEIISLNILTHESMHARGEYNEAKTECQAVQRNYRAAKLLGIPDPVAKKNALEYYIDYYLKRNKHDSYFSDECAPDKAMDEHLSDSTWK